MLRYIHGEVESLEDWDMRLRQDSKEHLESLRNLWEFNGFHWGHIMLLLLQIVELFFPGEEGLMGSWDMEEQLMR